MKKILFALCLSLIIFSSHAENVTTNKVLDGVGSGVTAIHGDTRDAISTLHQDASKIVETAYTDSKSVVGIIYDDVNKIVEYAAPKLEAGLIVLAQTLKTTVAEVYEAMIRKQIAVSISNLFYGLFGLLFLYIAYRIAKSSDNNLEINQFGKKVWKAQSVVGLGLALCAAVPLLIAFMVHFQEMVMGFYAPKYGAIKEIVTIVDTLLK